MNDDDMVTLEVTGDREWVREKAKNASGPLGAAARRWVAAHDRPERREFVLAREDGVLDPDVIRCSHAVAVEDLQPGDRVAGREVESVTVQDGIRFVGRLVSAYYPPGTLVVLDGDQ